MKCLIILTEYILEKCTVWSRGIFGVHSVSGRKLVQDLEKAAKHYLITKYAFAKQENLKIFFF